MSVCMVPVHAHIVAVVVAVAIVERAMGVVTVVMLPVVVALLVARFFGADSAVVLVLELLVLSGILLQLG